MCACVSPSARWQCGWNNRPDVRQSAEPQIKVMRLNYTELLSRLSVTVRTVFMRLLRRIKLDWDRLMSWWTGSQQTTRTVIHLLSSRFVSLNVPYQLHEPDVGVLLMECNGSEPCTGSGWRSRSSCSSSSWPGIWGWCTATAPETTQTSSGQSPQINNIHRNKLIIWTDRGH